MESKLTKHAYNTYKIAPFSSWILGITTGVLIASVIALDLPIPFISLLTFPLLVLPMIFSSTLQHIIFKTKGQLTLSSSLRAFALYFKRQYNSSFGFWFSLLKMIIAFLSLEMVISFITSYVMQITHPGFAESIDSFYLFIENGDLTMERLNEVLFMNNSALFIYMCIVLFPSYYLAILFFIYNLSRSSIMIYYRMQFVNLGGRFVNYVYRDALRRNRMKMFKDYWSINWPLYLLLTIGFVGGSILGYYWKHSLFTMLSLGLLSGTTLSMFFLPFYFSNQEALYDFYDAEFKKSTTNVTKYLISSLQSNIELSNEEKERLEKRINDLSNPLEDNKEDDNKKDPGGS